MEDRCSRLPAALSILFLQEGYKGGFVRSRGGTDTEIQKESPSQESFVVLPLQMPSTQSLVFSRSNLIILHFHLHFHRFFQFFPISQFLLCHLLCMFSQRNYFPNRPKFGIPSRLQVLSAVHQSSDLPSHAIICSKWKNAKKLNTIIYRNFSLNPLCFV